MAARQTRLFKASRPYFGGRLLHGKRRSQRPLGGGNSLHLVFRSSWATGENSFLKFHNRSAIKNIITVTAKQYGVRLYHKAIASNHVHLIVRAKRILYVRFIRVMTSRIASHVMKGLSFKEFTAGQTHCEVQGKGQRFFQFRPFTRILAWGRDYRTCCAYLLQNTLEALGFIQYTQRPNDRYQKWIREHRHSEA